MGIGLHSAKGLKIKHLRWWIVGLLLCATMINYLDRQALSIAAPVVREKFGMTNDDYSKIVNAFLVSYAIMMPIAGRIIDWLGTRLGFTMAVLWWGTANVLTAMASGVMSFRVFRFLLGVGEAGNFPASIKTVAEWFPAKEKAMATGIFNMGAGLGAIIAPPMIGYLVLTYGWQYGFVVTGILTVIWAPLWHFLYRRPHENPYLSAEERELIRAGQEEETEAPKAKGQWKEMVFHKELWGCIIAKFLSDPVWSFYVFWLPDYLYSARGFSLKQIAMFAWLPFVTADIGCLFGGAISSFFIKRGMHVLTARKVGLCICASMMPIAIIAARVNNPYLALACISLATFGHQAWSSNLLTLPADLFPKRQVATAYGLAGSSGAWGGVVFSWYAGAWIDKVGYAPIFTLVGLMHVIAAIVIIFMVKGKMDVKASIQ